MTTTTAVAVMGVVSALGFTIAAALPQPQATDIIPWKDVAGGSAALLLLAALVLFLRFLTQDRTARDAERAQDREHVEKVVENCTAMTAKLGADFTETQTNLIQSVRDDHQVARRELYDLVRDIRRQQDPKQ